MNQPNLQFSSFLILLSGKKSAAYVTNLSFLISKTHLDPSNGIRRKVIIELSLLGILSILMIVVFFLPSDEREGNLFRVKIQNTNTFVLFYQFFYQLRSFNYRTMHMPSPFLSCDHSFKILGVVAMLPYWEIMTLKIM